MVEDEKNSKSHLLRQSSPKMQILNISRVLKNAKTRYQMIENLSLALVTIARSLRPYIQSHQIMVRINHPIQIVLKES